MAKKSNNRKSMFPYSVTFRVSEEMYFLIQKYGGANFIRRLILDSPKYIEITKKK